MARARVLIVEDKVNMLKLCREILQESFEVETASNGQMALERLDARSFDVVLTDVRMPLLDGRQLLDEVRRRSCDAAVVLMTAYATVERAVDVMRAGAFTYVRKPFEPNALAEIVQAAAEHRRERQLARQVCTEIDARFGMAALVGRSAAMLQVFTSIDRAHRDEAPILLQGESGTGRTLASRVIHEDSGRPNEPFLVIEPRSVREKRLSELLCGESQEAYEGTLLVREIASLPFEQQRELARTLGGRTRYRLAATSSLDLNAEATAGRFCPALLAHLQPGAITLPALRERREDIPLLAGHFVAKHAPRVAPSVTSVSRQALDLLAAHDFPDNVRGLEQAIERALIVCRGDTIDCQDLEHELTSSGTATSMPLDPMDVSYREALALSRERTSQQYITALLRTFDGNVTRAADLAGLERESLHRLMRRYGIRSDDFKPPLDRGSQDVKSGT